MSWGSLIGAIGGAFGLGDIGGIIGGGLDAFLEWDNMNDLQDAQQNVFNQQAALAALQAKMAGEDHAFSLALRNKILGQNNELAAALRAAYAALGPSFMVDGERVQRDYEALRSKNFSDVDRSLDRVVSSRYADDIVKGRNAMPTFQRDQVRYEGEEYAGMYREADQKAYDAAISRNASLAGLLQDSRSFRLDELSGVLDQPISRNLTLAGLLNPSESAYRASASNGDLLDFIGSGASQANQAFGDRLADLSERIRSGFGGATYGLPGTSGKGGK